MTKSHYESTVIRATHEDLLRIFGIPKSWWVDKVTYADGILQIEFWKLGEE